jgi:uncharacterized membrane protein
VTAPTEPVRGERSALGLVLAALATLGLVISAYLSWTKLNGIIPPCLPGGGCETVASSPYSAVAGVPVAVFGVGYSAVMLALAVGWWRSGDRRLVLAAYGLGLAGVLVEAYLVYLELFVIHAVCEWCVTYGVTIVLGFVVAGLAVSRRDPESAP